MKMSHLAAAAGLLVAALGASAPAEAYPYYGNGYYKDYPRDYGRHRGWERHDRRDRHRGHYRRGYYGRDHYGRGYAYGTPRCWVEWRSHRRVRVCR